MAKAVFRKKPQGFVPVDDEARELFSRAKDGRDVLIEVTLARNPRHHRLFYAILNFCVMHAVAENGEARFATIEEAKTAIKIATGEVDPYIDAETGKTFFVLRSISYASMDQVRFAAFFDRATFVIADRWMPAGTTAETVRVEIEAMIEPVHSHSERAA